MNYTNTKRLTPAQKRALAKLTPVYQQSGDLRESIETLEALVRKGYADSVFKVTDSWVFRPRIIASYKLSKVTK